MATGPVTSRQLYANPGGVAFRRGELSRLDAYLATKDANTSVLPITALEDVLLTPEGVTQADGYRYTAMGFAQIAQEVATGLSMLLSDVSGAVRRPDAEPTHYDLPAAISMFNTVLTLRFDLLQRKRIIRDDQEQLIDGIVGSNTRFMENRGFFQQAAASTQLSGIPVEFFAAKSAGRRLTLWFRSQSPVFQVFVDRTPVEFWAGYYFFNGEATGTSLRGTDAIFTPYGCALGPFPKGGRVRHYGTNFLRRAEALFNRLMERELKLDIMQDGAERLLQTSLKLVGDDEERAFQRERLIQVLCRRGIGQYVATDIVDNAMLVGSDRKPQPAHRRVDPTGIFAGRTAFDLYCSLLRRSKNLGLGRRERVEQVAYDLLLGKFKV